MSDEKAWRDLFLREIRELRKEQSKAYDEITICRIEIAKLKIRAGLWGLGAGGVAVIVGAIVKAIFQ